MIELLLQAERALSVGLLDRAETLYRQVANADPRNSIAIVGLSRVTLDRGDDVGALELARRALTIDPENVAAQRMVARLEEVIDYRTAESSSIDVPEPVAEAEPEIVAEADPEPEIVAEAEPEPEIVAEAEPEPEIVAVPEIAAVPEVAAEPQVAAEPEVAVEPQPVAEPPPGRLRSFIDRIFGRS
jgi:hypothetical protein